MKRLLAILMVMLLFACQPTPEEDIVTNKGEQDIISMAHNSAEPNATLSFDGIKEYLQQKEILLSSQADENTYSFRTSDYYTLQANGLPITFNAMIQVPKSSSWSVYEVERKPLEAQKAKDIIDYMSGESSVFEGIYWPTKAEFAEMMTDAETSETVASINKSYSEAGSSQTVQAFLEEYYDNAEVENSSKLFPWSDFMKNNHFLWEGCFFDSALGEYKSFSIYPEGTGVSFGFSKYGVRSAKMVYNGITVGSAPGETLCDSSVSIEYAIAAAEQLMRAWGISDMVLSREETSLAKRINLFTGESLSVGWLLVYRKSFNGLPCVCQEEKPYEEEFAEMWPRELFSIFVDNHGAWSCQWIGPSQIGQIVGDNVALLDFSDVFARIRAQIEYENSSVDTDFIMHVNVTNITIGYCIIPQKDNITAGYAIPAWLVEYQWDLYDGRIDYHAFAINAMDGSIISVTPNRGC